MNVPIQSRQSRARRGRDGSFTRGRKFSSDDLQLMLLALLEVKPSHGYELVKELDARSGGYWAPSPGMVYPALTYLQELGFTSATAEGNKKSYALLSLGLEHLNAHRDEAQELLATLVHMARKMKYIEGAIAANNESSGDDAWLTEFVEARLKLKRALLLKSTAGPQEQKRMAAILENATRLINDTTSKPD
ncbi:PadR family transcriptional regulator [Alcaligenaceae bacterium]|nr:PadR family transcriptional regulator [Alcaligenaceae bacterium]